MARSIITLEGADCTGKTTVARILQELVPNHAMIKLSQPRGLTGQDRLYALTQTFKKTVELWEAMGTNNGIMDRFTTSERVYGPLFHGFTLDMFRAFDPIELYMTRLGGRLVLLTASRDELEERLIQKAVESPNEGHADVVQVLKIQDRYLHVAEWETQLEPVIIDTSGKQPREVAYEVLSRVGLPELVPSGDNNAPGRVANKSKDTSTTAEVS